MTLQQPCSAGHGDFHPIVLAPASVQEAIDFTVLAFELADKYRHLVILAADGQIGQMMEPVEFPGHGMEVAPAKWAVRGDADHPAVAASTVDALAAPPRPLIRVPRFEGRRGHPVWFSRALIAEFLALPAHGAALKARFAEGEPGKHSDWGIPS